MMRQCALGFQGLKALYQCIHRGLQACGSIVCSNYPVFQSSLVLQSLTEPLEQLRRLLNTPKNSYS